MGLNSCWEMTGRQEGGEKKSVFSVYAVAIPLLPQVEFCLGNTQGNYSVCLALFMVSECWSCLSLPLKCMSAVNALFKDSHCRGNISSWWLCIRGIHLQTCILIFKDLVTSLHVEQKQLLYLEMLSIRGKKCLSPCTFLPIRAKSRLVKLWNRRRYCIGSLPSLVKRVFE